MNELDYRKQLLEAVNYAIEKLSLIPAFGDSIGNRVNKAELGIALNKLNAVNTAHILEWIGGDK